jgi:chromate reductase
VKILGIVGSLRADSFNKSLMDNLNRLLTQVDPTVEFTTADIANLPLFNEDLEADFPQVATQLKQQITDADGILVMTPEYNRSMSGALKNALDWTSRPWGQSAWGGKVVGIGGVSPSAIGTALAQADLREVLCFLGVKLLTGPELYLGHANTDFQENRQVTESVEGFLKTYVEAFLQLVKA